MEFLNTIDWGLYALFVASAIGVASIIVALTPTKLDDTAIGWVRKGLKLVAFNVLGANDSAKFQARIDEMEEYAAKLEAAMDEQAAKKATKKTEE